MARSSDISRIEHKIKRLPPLIEANWIFSLSLNLDQIFENVMTISKQVMNTDTSILMLIDENANELPLCPSPSRALFLTSVRSQKISRARS